MAGKAKVAVGVNCSLALYSGHLQSLAAEATKTPTEWRTPGEYDREKILAMLRGQTWRRCIFYCHAASTPEGRTPC